MITRKIKGAIEAIRQLREYLASPPAHTPDTPPMRRDAHHLRTLRRAMGLTQEEAGEMCGVSKAAICRAERGRTNEAGRYLRALRAHAGPRDTRNLGTDPAEELRSLRKRHGLSQKEAARMLGTSAKTLSHAERGVHDTAWLYLRQLRECLAAPPEQSTPPPHIALRRWRKKNDLYLRDVAAMADVSVTLASDAERHTLDTPAARRVYEAAGIDHRPMPIPAAARRLRSMRRAMGLTQEEAGDLIGVTGTAIGNAETGRSSSAERYTAMLRAHADPRDTRNLGTDPAEELRALRKRHGLTQKEAGQLLGVGNNTISNAERGVHDTAWLYLRQLQEAL